MCLTYTKRQDKNKPWNHNRIRWKKLIGDINNQALHSTLYNHTWKVGVWQIVKKKPYTTIQNMGFHVWLNRFEAQSCLGSHEYAVKLEVRGFCRSGRDGWGTPCETWRQARIVAIYDNKKNNVTKEFFIKKNKK